MQKSQGNNKIQATAAAAVAGQHLQALRLVWFLAALLLNFVVTSGTSAALSSNRYLFVVETSRSMQKREEGLKQAVTNLLGSGMRGQLQAGDTLGLWTYNNQLHAGVFPLQTWVPEKRDVLTSRMLMFLGAEKFEKAPAFEKVVPSLDPLIRNSDFLTIVIISTGEEKMKGTPFEDRINSDYKLWHDQQQKAKMPFITILRAERGTLTDARVTPVPFPLELPPLPKAFVAEKPVVTNSLPPPPKVAQPLIISGHKSAETIPPKSIGLGMVLEPEGATSPAEQTSDPHLSAPAEKLVPDFQTAAPLQESLGSAVTNSKQSSAAINAAAKSTTVSVPPAAALQPSPAPIAASRPPALTSLASDQKVFAREANPSAVANQASIIVPASNALGSRVIWAAAVFVTGLAVGLLFVFARKTHEPLSLITRSLEREKK